MFTTNYWTFNGQTRGSDWRSGYNLKFWNQTNTTGNGFEISGNYVTFEYVEMEGTNGNYTGGQSDFGLELSGGVTNFYMGYSWLHDSGSDLAEMFTSSNVTYEYNVIERNFAGAPAGGHSQAFGICGMQTMIVRYNYFRDIVNTGVIDTDCPGYNNDSNWYIYGNTDYWTTSVYTGTGGGQADGFIGLFGEIFSGNFQVYNNTFAGITSSSCSNGNTNCSTTVIFECGTSCGGSGCSAGNCGTPAATIYNNLWWNVCNGGNNSVGSGAQRSPTADYGEGYCPTGGCTNNSNCSGGFQTGGTHDVAVKTGNPFVNFDGSSNFNFTLQTDTAAGYSIPNWGTLPSGCTGGTNCFNMDPLGATRGADGVIDRGAFQMTGAPPASPYERGCYPPLRGLCSRWGPVECPAKVALRQRCRFLDPFEQPCCARAFLSSEACWLVPPTSCQFDRVKGSGS